LAREHAAVELELDALGHASRPVVLVPWSGRLLDLDAELSIEVDHRIHVAHDEIDLIEHWTIVHRQPPNFGRERSPNEPGASSTTRNKQPIEPKRANDEERDDVSESIDEA
jgi:hypothetical protein